METVIILDEVSTPIAYGHLEKENDELWLGLAVADGHTGKGLGRKILRHLVGTAKANSEPSVKLSVDKDNYKAQGLYRSAGFVQIAEHTTYLLFELELI